MLAPVWRKQAKIFIGLLLVLSCLKYLSTYGLSRSAPYSAAVSLIRVSPEIRANYGEIRHIRLIDYSVSYQRRDWSFLFELELDGTRQNGGANVHVKKAQDQWHAKYRKQAE